MKIFPDTANVQELQEVAAMGLLDGVTTNPSLIAKEKRPFRDLVDEICRIVDGVVNLEVVATDVLYGLGSACLVTAGFASALDLGGETERGRTIGLYQGAVYGVYPLGSVVGGFLTDAFGYGRTFLGCSGAVLGVTLLAAATVSETGLLGAGADRPLPEARLRDYPRLLDRRIRRYTALKMLSGFAIWGVLCAERSRSAVRGEQREPVVRCSVKFDARLIFTDSMTIAYRMTSSARSSSDCEIVRPMDFAALRLITSSNFEGCSTGRLAGLAPLRILSTKTAARRQMSMNTMTAKAHDSKRRSTMTRARLPKGFTEKRADVDGVTINYKIGGQGPVVVLLHGYAQTSHMWRPLMPLLATSHTVIAPDLRGAGGSARPPAGYEKKTLAKDIRGLVRQLGYRQVTVVGHDIGLMVAYAYAAQYPGEVSKVVLLDAFLPGVGAWKDVWLLRDLWHFHFYGKTPLALVKGRERIYFEHFWNDFAADKTRSVPEADRQIYAAAYARADGMRAGFEYFKAFEQDAKDFAALSAVKLDIPVLVLTGERASGTFLIEQAKLVATHVSGTVVKGAGHWLMEEATDQVVPAIVAFLD